MRRQGQLLSALLNQSQRALAADDWEGAQLAMRVFAERLDRRIELSRDMCQRIQDRYQIPSDGLEAQRVALAIRSQEALDALIEGDPESHLLVGGLRALFEAHLAEEQQVLWPLIAAEFRA